jgi:hypothetical protein
MGLFDSITGFISGSDNPEQSSSRSGFALLPQEIQDAFTGFASRGTGLLGGGAGDSMFTPMGATQDENNAFGMFRQGFAPTSAADVSRDVGLFMNPFDQYVIDDINRQSQGDYSLLKQAVTDAGQFGSNRQVLGASELERQRLNAIGSFKQNQYNNALNMAMNQLSGLRQQDAQNLMGIGSFQRGLDTQTRQAPVSALNAWANLIGALPQSGGSESSATGANHESGLMDAVGSIGSLAGLLF